LSAAIVAILAGMAVRNLVRLPAYVIESARGMPGRVWRVLCGRERRPRRDGCRLPTEAQCDRDHGRIGIARKALKVARLDEGVKLRPSQWNVDASTEVNAVHHGNEISSPSYSGGTGLLVR
jgi:hypothetical protein